MILLSDNHEVKSK